MAEGNEGEVKVVESAPPAPQPVQGAEGDEPRARMHELAGRLKQSRPRQLLAEYLRLRRALM